MTSNNLNNKITVIPLSLTDKMKISDFNLSILEKSGSQSTFSEIYGEDGKEFIPKLKYKTLFSSKGRQQSLSKKSNKLKIQ